MKKHLLFVFVCAVIIRVAWSILGWRTSLIEAQEDSITITYQRSAYLLYFGYGYSQTVPGSEAYYELSAAMDNIRQGKDFEPKVSRDRIYNTSHYPPGWPLLAAFMFKITSIPIPYVMQGVGIIVDLCSMLLLYLLARKKFIALAKPILWAYAMFPPFIASSVSMTPDVFILFYCNLLPVCYIRDD